MGLAAVPEWTQLDAFPNEIWDSERVTWASDSVSAFSSNIPDWYCFFILCSPSSSYTYVPCSIVNTIMSVGFYIQFSIPQLLTQILPVDIINPLSD